MTVWTVVSVDRIVDGDSLLLTRRRDIGAADGLTISATDGTPVRVRLAWVDTPERNEVAWGEAKRDLADWVTHHPFLTLWDFGRDNFGRVLGDLRSDAGESASQWLMRERGWPPYKTATAGGTAA